jgi:alpha-aminoadipic semialdehyde synthase
MSDRIGIRLEDKNIWERRTPLIPTHVNALTQHHEIDVCVQSSPIRAFSDQEYAKAGAQIVSELKEAPVIFAIKEIPTQLLEPHKTYIFFSHTIKGQEDNMPMLQRLLDLGCQLIDYEKIVDDQGRRLVYFGDYAGMAGMIDTLWAYGQRLTWEGTDNPFSRLTKTHAYGSLDEAKIAVRDVGDDILEAGLPASLSPLVCGFAGYGNVSRGAQEIFDLLPVQPIEPEDLASVDREDRHQVYKVVFREEHMVEPIDPKAEFELQDYYDHPEKYRSAFERYLPHLDMLINGIYWTAKYPRLVTRQYLREAFNEKPLPRLKVIGDISCDTEGAIECNLKSTTPGDPVYVYDPQSEQITDGYQGFGVVVLAVDNLPCELPRESSTHFSGTLMPFVPEIATADYAAPLPGSSLSDTIQRAVITWQGQLTSGYQYLSRYL